MKIGDRLWSGLWPLIGVAMLMATPVSAQDNAICPAENRLTVQALVAFFMGVQGGAHRMVLGTENGHITMLFFLGENDSQCRAEMLIGDGIAGPSGLKHNSNICTSALGGAPGGVMVEILSVSRTYECGSRTLRLDPLAYDGFALSVYLGDSDDEYYGGAGIDWVYGGSGADFLVDPAGAGDAMFGEHSGDLLWCSTGPNTFCDGGAGADRIEEQPARSSDRLLGGSNSDQLFACRPGRILCGSNTDTAYTLPTTPTDHLCEFIKPLDGCN